MTLAEEVRAEFARIRRRFEGCDLASIRTDSVRKIEAYVDDLEARVAAQAPDPAPFEVTDRYDADHIKRSFAKQVQFDAEEARAQPYPTRRSVL